MGRRGGSADLPLHGGRVPSWLATRMAKLGRVIVEAVAHEYGRDEVLRRLAHPFWFQCFGAVMGMDWHSSGITTSVVSALKRGLQPVAGELGLHVCGGRGRHSRKTPTELLAVGERSGLDGTALARTSRLVAKVDSAAVQDGYELYLHAFIVADDGKWTVVQQGMNAADRLARRYHWASFDVGSFVDDPHVAIDGEPAGQIINLADRRAERARALQLDLVRLGPDAALDEVQAALPEYRAPSLQPSLPSLVLPAHHDVRAGNVVMRRLHGALAAAEAAAPGDFPELLLTAGVGRRTLWALAMVGEVIHGAPSRFSDPARFSLAHGGKDGHPFPVPLAVYDETIGVLRRAVDKAKLGNEDRLAAVHRLDQQARRLERAGGPSFEALVAGERARSHQLGGMTVHGPALPPKPQAKARGNQLELLPRG